MKWADALEYIWRVREGKIKKIDLEVEGFITTIYRVGNDLVRIDMKEGNPK